MTSRFKTETLLPEVENFEKIAALLNQDEIVALPTETVYGLAGNATHPNAVMKIFEAKERPTFDPLIVHVSEKNLNHPSPIKALVDQGIVHADVLEWKSLEQIESAIHKFWPGPLTIVLPRGHMIPNEVTANQDTVAIRMPAHRWFQEILFRVPFPLAAPSANRFGRISPTQAAHVEQELNGRIPAILDGGSCEVGVESTIVKLEDAKTESTDASPIVSLLRPGKIGVPELELAFKTSVLHQKTLGQNNQAQLAPGMLDQHYAPRKPLYLLPCSFTDTKVQPEIDELFMNGPIKKPAKIGVLASCSFPESLKAWFTSQGFQILEVLTLSKENDLNEAASNLFHSLRDLDTELAADLLLADCPKASAGKSQSGLESALKDRLNRASINKPLFP